MKFLKKLKSGNFWVSLISAGVLIAEGIFDFELKTEYLNQILLGLMGLMTLFGIVSDHGSENVVLQSNNTNAKSETDNASSNAGISNIKSICDTISLLLNKVSFSHDSELEDSKNEENDKKEELKEDSVKETLINDKEQSSNNELEESSKVENNIENKMDTNSSHQNSNTENIKLEQEQVVIQSIVN